jgi:hypothetical protein
MEDLLIFEENYDEDFRFEFSYSMLLLLNVATDAESAVLPVDF